MKRLARKIFVVFRLVRESVIFAFSSLKVDKFRTFLSLLGVSIGIFSIVAVFSAVDALQSNIKEGISFFRGDVVSIDQYPWMPEEGEEYAWWDYMKRPSIEQDDFRYLKKTLVSAQTIVYSSSFDKAIKYKRNRFSDGMVVSSTPGIEEVYSVEVESGRNISSSEYANGTGVAIIGASVAETLFEGHDPLGKMIKIGNYNTVVIGVMKKQGESIVSFIDTDNTVVISLNYGKMMHNVKRGGGIMVVPKEGVSQDEFVAELTSRMRASRRLTPRDKNNFSINIMTLFTEVFDELLGILNIVGWLIGGFSLLIGGFGIANIMFVSVKERTSQIGLQKALGAKRYVIMIQFLVEAAVLSLSGGVLGIGLVFLITLLLQDIEQFKIALSFANAIKGLIISVVIGVLSGIIPAYFAARLDPVLAINK